MLSGHTVTFKFLNNIVHHFLRAADAVEQGICQSGSLAETKSRSHSKATVLDGQSHMPPDILPQSEWMPHKKFTQARGCGTQALLQRRALRVEQGEPNWSPSWARAPDKHK
ncbi:hypothetical protein SRHO_G00283740 [Serrasalmus rhombeus]